MKNILILGLGAFGFAIAKHLGENNPDKEIYASEVNPEIFTSIKENRTHPYFFPGTRLPENIKLIDNTSELLPKVDIIISVIPCQFIGGAFSGMKDSLKDGVTILNLSKGIDNQTLQTTSEKLGEVLAQHPHPNFLLGKEKEQASNKTPLSSEGEGLGVRYAYAYLAGGMIAAELVEEKMLGVDIVTENKEVGEQLKELFHSGSLDIHFIHGNPKNTELYAALKNIIALILGYYEGQGNGASTLGYYLTKLLTEVSLLIKFLGGDPKLRFTDNALGGDIIATCFGGSRNRLLGNMLGEGKSISEALTELQSQKKIAEGYETLKGVYTLTKGKDEFTLINKFGGRYL